jgi:hypothetical protein
MGVHVGVDVSQKLGGEGVLSRRDAVEKPKLVAKAAFFEKRWAV